MTYLDRFLGCLEKELPEICTDKILVERLPDIFRSLSSIHRMRTRRQTPAYFFIEPNYFYLKSDVLNWLRERYQCGITYSPIPLKKRGPKPKIKEILIGAGI
jgi:hypothetical protein